jgi:hypothetical protein
MSGGQAALWSRSANRLASLYPRQRIREVSLLRGLRLVASAPLRLRLDDQDMNGRWEELPDQTRLAVLGLLSRLIAKTVLSGQEDGGE